MYLRRRAVRARPRSFEEDTTVTSAMTDRLDTMRGTFGGGSRNGSDLGRKVRRIFIAGTALLAALVLLPSAVTYVNPGHVGIVIHRAGGGVDKQALPPG